MLLAGAADPHQIVGGRRRPGGAGGITRRHRPAAAPRAPRDPPRPGRAGTDRPSRIICPNGCRGLHLLRTAQLALPPGAHRCEPGRAHRHGRGRRSVSVDQRLVPDVSMELVQMMLGGTPGTRVTRLDAETFAVLTLDRAGFLDVPEQGARRYLRELRPLWAAVRSAPRPAGRRPRSRCAPCWRETPAQPLRICLCLDGHSELTRCHFGGRPAGPSYSYAVQATGSHLTPRWKFDRR